MTRRIVESFREVPAPDLWEEIERRMDGELERPASPRVAVRVAVAVVALAAVAAVLALVLMAFLGTDRSTPVPAGRDLPGIPPGQPTVVHSAILGNYPAVLAAGGGSVWEASWPGRVTRYDPASGERVQIVRRLPGGLTAMAWGAGSLWMTVDAHRVGGDTAGPALLRLTGPRPTVRVAASLPSRTRVAAFGFGSVWVGGEGDVVRFDPSTGRTKVVFHQAGTEVWGVATARDTVWAAVCAAWPANRGRLIAVDPATDRVVAEVGTGGRCPSRVASGEGLIWYVMGHGSRSFLGAVDPATRRPSGRMIGLGRGGTPVVLLVASGTVWVTWGEPEANPRYLRRIDPRSRRWVGAPVPLTIIGGVVQIQGTVGGGALWLAPSSPWRLSKVELCSRYWLFWRRCIPVR